MEDYYRQYTDNSFLKRLSTFFLCLSTFLGKFARESIEAFVYIYVIVLVTEKNTPVSKIVRLALTVGMIQSFVHHYDTETHQQIKQGMTFSVGSSFLGSA